jgi:purine-cytosine permease-like protein
MILGAACMTGILTNPVFLSNYNENSIGGLFYAILVHDSLHGFGEFCVVLMAITTVANNIPNMYSLALSAQTVWSVSRKVPRVVWTIIGSGLSVAIAIPAYFYFSAVMQNFMNIIGYWLAIYSSIALSEHFIYRKGTSGYNIDDYENKDKLPVGYAAMFAFVCGVAGALVGMSQVWWIGPLGKLIGDPTYGGDIGFELGFAFSFIGFNATRWLELKYVGR